METQSSRSITADSLNVVTFLIAHALVLSALVWSI